MSLIASLYVAHALMSRSGESGLSAAWLALLLLPGALTAHLSWRHDKPEEAAREGGMAGLLMGHFAAALLVSVLLVGVASTDWTGYAAQVGPQIAEDVREAAIPATLVVGAITALVAYVGCALAGWLGALAYIAVRRVAGARGAQGKASR
jgi:cellobiose-specific phosphotransferase system component IIC